MYPKTYNIYIDNQTIIRVSVRIHEKHTTSLLLEHNAEMRGRGSFLTNDGLVVRLQQHLPMQYEMCFHTGVRLRGGLYLLCPFRRERWPRGL
jgi:hypothetical protein